MTPALWLEGQLGCPGLYVFSNSGSSSHSIWALSPYVPLQLFPLNPSPIPFSLATLNCHIFPDEFHLSKDQLILFFCLSSLPFIPTLSALVTSTVLQHPVQESSSQEVFLSVFRLTSIITFLQVWLERIAPGSLAKNADSRPVSQTYWIRALGQNLGIHNFHK